MPKFITLHLYDREPKPEVYVNIDDVSRVEERKRGQFFTKVFLRSLSANSHPEVSSFLEVVEPYPIVVGTILDAE